MKAKTWTLVNGVEIEEALNVMIDGAAYDHVPMFEMSDQVPYIQDF